jgi:hypothetical protein
MLCKFQWSYGHRVPGQTGSIIMTMTAPPLARFIGQYRLRGHRGLWSTLCERATEAEAWDELLSMSWLVGCELSVRRIEDIEAEPV